MFIWKLTSRKKYSIAIVHGPDHKIQLQTSQSPSSWASVVATSVRKPRKDQRIETSPHASTSPTSPPKYYSSNSKNKLDPPRNTVGRTKKNTSSKANWPRQNLHNVTLRHHHPASDTQTAQLGSHSCRRNLILLISLYI
jgi:hypothetical protein